MHDGVSFVRYLRSISPRRQGTHERDRSKNPWNLRAVNRFRGRSRNLPLTPRAKCKVVEKKSAATLVEEVRGQTSRRNVEADPRRLGMGRGGESHPINQRVTAGVNDYRAYDAALSRARWLEFAKQPPKPRNAAPPVRRDHLSRRGTHQGFRK